MFEAYQPNHSTLSKGTEKFVTINKSGSISVSQALANEIKLEKGQRHELYFDRETTKIGIKFVPAGSNGNSRAVTSNNGGGFSMQCPAFFRQFNIKTPAKATRFTPEIDGDLMVITYPEIMVGK